MGLLKGALETGIAVKAMEVAKREASKPENQRRARQLIAKLSGRGGTKSPR